jgi:hypothetical protein
MHACRTCLLFRERAQRYRAHGHARNSNANEEQQCRSTSVDEVSFWQKALKNIIGCPRHFLWSLHKSIIFEKPCGQSFLVSVSKAAPSGWIHMIQRVRSLEYSNARKEQYFVLIFQQLKRFYHLWVLALQICPSKFNYSSGVKTRATGRVDRDADYGIIRNAHAAPGFKLVSMCTPHV